ncbi:ATP-dependent DNA ligase [Streptomyces flaveolus]|uniref:ATP-dependent DNA ligase n=1 Tax=Streptomyces flaveolus TaxID=67297 RepID=UPI0036FD3589
MFDVLDTADGPLIDEPYRTRRALLEALFADGVLAAPFVLCPATIDRATAEDWLDPAWGAVGIEGIVVSGLAQKYQQARRGWIKVRSRASGARTGGLSRPKTW